jgi:2-methylisocitrate lyase-like PEP mutase family enzyme
MTNERRRVNTTSDKRTTFKALHQSGCFVLPNPWNIGSARMLQHLGFPAIATTSTGFAWSIGRPDYAVTMDDVLEHLVSLGEKTDLPINADFESGFARAPETLAANVDLVIETGIAGFSIQDRDMQLANALFETRLAVERIRAARSAIDHSGEDVLLVGRTEQLLLHPEAVSEAIDRLVAFAEAGADCLYAPGVSRKQDIDAMVRAVSPKPLNVLAPSSITEASELADLGVRRISVGGALAKVGWTAVIEAAEKMRAGSFQRLSPAMPGKDLNEMFRSFP